MMKRSIIFLLFMVALNGNAQKHWLSIKVQNSETKQGISSVNVKFNNENYSTDNSGVFNHGLSMGKVNLQFSHINYNVKSVVLNIQSDTTIYIYLAPKVFEIKEFKVKGKRKQRGSKNIAIDKDKISLNPRYIKMLPTILSEPDPIKAVQNLPGVNTGLDGNNAFFVRGGNYDQNQILIDNAPVYKINHVFGLFSTFDANSVQNLDFFKGPIPIRYSGRASSVVDMEARSGNMNKFHGAFGFSLLGLSGNFNGPIVKNKLSFSVTGRMSYLDLLPEVLLEEESAGFKDLNVKLNYTINKKNKLSYMYFRSKDEYFSTNPDTKIKSNGIDWTNNVHSLNWNSLLTKRTNMIINMGLSMYNNDYYYYGFDSIIDTQEKQSLNNLFVKANVRTKLNNKLKLEYGFSLSNLKLNTHLEQNNVYNPNPKVINYDTTEKVSKYGVYTQLKYRKKRFRFTTGLRYQTLAGNYHSIEPRINIAQYFKNKAKISLYFDKVSQDIHQNSPSLMVLPYDRFMLSGEYIKPIKSYQYGLGYFYPFSESISAKADIYYKKTDNVLDFLSGKDLYFNPNYVDVLTPVKSQAYGFELYVVKDKGIVNGSMSYTYSKSIRYNDEILKGNWYNTPYDIPHNFNLQLNVTSRNKKWRYDMLFVAKSGRVVTLPIQIGRVVLISDRNAIRLAMYHRMDMGFSYTSFFKKKKRRLMTEWKIGVYNVYNKLNPYLISYDSETDRYVTTTLFPIIPTASVRFKF